MQNTSRAVLLPSTLWMYASRTLYPRNNLTDTRFSDFLPYALLCERLTAIRPHSFSVHTRSLAVIPLSNIYFPYTSLTQTQARPSRVTSEEKDQKATRHFDVNSEYHKISSLVALHNLMSLLEDRPYQCIMKTP